MKNSVLFSFLLIFSMLVSCSNSDNDKETVSGDYYPSTENNYWNYDVKTKSNNSADTESQDFVAVKSATVSSFELEANSGNLANGYMNLMLTNGILYKTESTLTEKGKLQLPIEGFEDFTIDFNGAVLYDLNADKNETLSLYNGDFSKELQGFPITIEYKLEFSKINDLSSLKVNNNTYNTVTGSNISLRVSMYTTIEIQGVDTDFPLIDDQDILSIDNYFAENVGLIKSTATIDFSMNSTTIALLQTLGVDLDLPEAKSSTNTQELSSYLVNN